MKRRQFIRIGGYGAAGATVAGGLTTDWFGRYGNPIADPGTDGDRVVPTFCELCFWKCGVLAHVKDGRVTKIKGNPKDPLSSGRLCPRGTGGTGLLYDPDRLKQPLIRARRAARRSSRRSPGTTRSTSVAENFERIKAEHGAEALALFSHGYGGTWFKHLFKAYGSPNIAAPSYAQCRGPREVGFQLTFGVRRRLAREHRHAEQPAAWCSSAATSARTCTTPRCRTSPTAIRNGADLIVVDPRFSMAAAKARYWLPIKPGTDIALLLAWMHVIIGEGLYDRDYIEQYAYGFEQLQAHVKATPPSGPTRERASSRS